MPRISLDNYHTGFGHIGFLVDDLDGACQWLEDNGVPFKKKPQEGNMVNVPCTHSMLQDLICTNQSSEMYDSS